eukprot:213888_1
MGTRVYRCVEGMCSKTYEYDATSILTAKDLLHFLKKRVGFSFAGQSQHRDALEYAFVDLFGWKVLNEWGYNVRVVYKGRRHQGRGYKNRESGGGRGRNRGNKKQRKQRKDNRNKGRDRKRSRSNFRGRAFRERDFERHF